MPALSCLRAKLDFTTMSPGNGLCRSGYAVSGRTRCFDGTVVLFRAEHASAETQGFRDESLGWGRFASHVAVRRTPGTHFTMTRGDNAKRLAKSVDLALRSLRSPGGK